MKTMQSLDSSQSDRQRRGGERGYALLGLLLALSIMSIYLVSSIAPDVKMQVQRQKETEMIYRGNQMAKAIARYYGVRRLQSIQLQVQPPYGHLTELKKLRDGVTLGVQEVKFARASELIDPMTGIEWEPVRARDPRINAVLQAYAAETGAIIPLSYLLLAGPPPKPHRIGLGSSNSEGTSSGTSSTTTPAAGQTGQPGQPGVVVKPPKSQDLDDDDDDDDDEVNDPLACTYVGSNLTPSRTGLLRCINRLCGCRCLQHRAKPLLLCLLWFRKPSSPDASGR